jgi:hypothetical protein
MYQERRAVQRIVTREVMRLERRLAIERGDVADASAPAGGRRRHSEPARRRPPRPS